jgi:phosphoglycolate phosphatase/pyrophosphatase PpaX
MEYKRYGGKIAVVSHSDADLIERDYRRSHPEGELLPDLIYGWDFDPDKRKPSPRPIREILDHFHLSPEKALIVDDLKPGLVMAEKTGVPFAAAGWSHDIPKIREYMEARSGVYFSKVEDFRRYILGETSTRD